jgi:predicted porin
MARGYNRLPLAAALLAAASSASAGIVIPAGDWNVEIGGNVNAFYSNTHLEGSKATNSIGTGLLPAELSVAVKTRQNDLDISGVVSFWTSTSADAANGVNAAALNRGAQINVRQSYLTFGDASWGTVLMGRNLGVFGSDAILSDMTLLSVGGNYAPGGTTTLGRIGQGYIYADWFGQINYSTPSFNGLQGTVAVLQPVSSQAVTGDMMYQGKVTYDFAADQVTGRAWVGGTTQKLASWTASGAEVGAKASFAGASVVGYYYNGDGLSSVTTNSGSAYGNNVLLGGLNGSLSGATGGTAATISAFGTPGTGPTTRTKDSGGYVQGTFVIPGIGTKLGASWGESSAEFAGIEAKTETWIVAAFHPLTKSLNLVAEYANADNSYTRLTTQTVKTTSLGAILFF